MDFDEKFFNTRTIVVLIRYRTKRIFGKAELFLANSSIKWGTFGGLLKFFVEEKRTLLRKCRLYLPAERKICFRTYLERKVCHAARYGLHFQPKNVKSGWLFILQLTVFRKVRKYLRKAHRTLRKCKKFEPKVLRLR